MTTRISAAQQNELVVMNADFRTADMKIAGRWARVPAAAAYDRGLSGEALRILVILAQIADFKTGIVRNSINSIAERANVTARQIKRHVRQLEICGYLRIVKRVRKTTGGYTSSERTLLFPRVHKRQTKFEPSANEAKGPQTMEGNVSPNDTVAPSSSYDEIGHHATRNLLMAYNMARDDTVEMSTEGASPVSANDASLLA